MSVNSYRYLEQMQAYTSDWAFILSVAWKLNVPVCKPFYMTLLNEKEWIKERMTDLDVDLAAWGGIIREDKLWFSLLWKRQKTNQRYFFKFFLLAKDPPGNALSADKVKLKKWNLCSRYSIL